jgi:hypothetical protein
MSDNGIVACNDDDFLINWLEQRHAQKVIQLPLRGQKLSQIEVMKAKKKKKLVA